ncbi:MAG: hypothetical protein AB7F64_08425 [Gammaproteobacteria bacterium]
MYSSDDEVYGYGGTGEMASVPMSDSTPPSRRSDWFSNLGSGVRNWLNSTPVTSNSTTQGGTAYDSDTDDLFKFSDPDLETAHDDNSVVLRKVLELIEAYKSDNDNVNADEVKPELLPEWIESYVIKALKQCIKDAQNKYAGQPKGGLWHHHGGTGLERVKAFAALVGSSTDLTQIQKEFQKFFSDPKTRANDHSYISYLLNELQKYPLVVAAINLAWLLGKYDTGINFDERRMLILPKPPFEFELKTLNTSKRNEVLDYTQADMASERADAVKSFALMLQPVDSKLILSFKQCVSRAFANYNCFRNFRTLRNTYGTGSAGMTATFASTSIPPLAVVAGIGTLFAGAYTNRNVGLLHPHGTKGNAKARKLEHAVAIATSLDEIRQAFEEYFSDRYYWGSKTRCHPHSFCAALFEQLSNHPEIIEHLNLHWFSPMRKKLELNVFDYIDLEWINLGSRSEIVGRPEIDPEVLKAPFELFMSLERDTLEKASSSGIDELEIEDNGNGYEEYSDDSQNEYESISFR